MPDDVQPAEGQGAEATPGIFDPYLSAVPEDARDTVAGYLKDAEKHVNERIADASSLEKQFGAYKDVDLSSYDPEGLSQLIAWHQQVTASPEAFKDWLSATAQEEGLTKAEAEDLAEAEETGEISQQQIQDMFQKMAEERLSPLQEQLSAIEQEKAVDFEEQAIGTAFGEIEAAEKLNLTKDQKAVILDLGMPLAYSEKGEDLPMGDASWVKAGFDRWREITAAGAAAFVEDKAGQPTPSLTTGGVPQMKPITSYADANEALRERLRQQS